MDSFDLVVNRQAFTVNAEPDMPLLWVLRDLLDMTGTKYSCGQGSCGACTVLLDGEAVRSCITPVSEVGDRDIITIEGLSPDGDHSVQRAWVEEKVVQCGYCQPGQIMNAVALLNANPSPTDDDINQAMGHVLCRCGSYQRIRAAIHRAAEMGAS